MVLTKTKRKNKFRIFRVNVAIKLKTFHNFELVETSLKICISLSVGTEEIKSILCKNTHGPKTYTIKLFSL